MNNTENYVNYPMLYLPDGFVAMALHINVQTFYAGVAPALIGAYEAQGWQRATDLPSFAAYVAQMMTTEQHTVKATFDDVVFSDF